MYDDIAALFHEGALQSYQEFIDTITSGVKGQSRHIKSAVNAATALYHIREHLPQNHQKSRSTISQLCPDYDLAADIANVSKHSSLTRGTPKIISARDLEEVQVLTEYEDAKGVFYGSEDIVEVKLIDGTTRNVAEILTNVVNFWTFSA